MNVRSLRVLAAAAATAILVAGPLACRKEPPPAPPDTETLGVKDGGRTVVPVNQVVTPAGLQVALPGLRPQALALSPDGRFLVVSGKTSRARHPRPGHGRGPAKVGLPAEDAGRARSRGRVPNILEPDKKGQLSYTGLVFSPDGRRVYLSNVNGSVKVFAVGPDGAVAAVPRRSPCPPADAPRREEEIPAGLALSRGRHAALRLRQPVEPPARARHRRRAASCGRSTSASPPSTSCWRGGKAYVSNWGGRRPGPGDLTGPAGRGTDRPGRPVRHVASEGSVSVVDLASRRPRAEVVVRLHASALAVSPDGRYVVCANAGQRQPQRHRHARPTPSSRRSGPRPSPADLFGASPNALAFDPGRQDPLRRQRHPERRRPSCRFDPGDRRRRRLAGLIPVGWFPGALAFDARAGTLARGQHQGPRRRARRPTSTTGAPGFNSHHYHGSVSLVPVPEAQRAPAADRGGR